MHQASTQWQTPKFPTLLKTPYLEFVITKQKDSAKGCAPPRGPTSIHKTSSRQLLTYTTSQPPPPNATLIKTPNESNPPGRRAPKGRRMWRRRYLAWQPAPSPPPLCADSPLGPPAPRPRRSAAPGNPSPRAQTPPTPRAASSPSCRAKRHHHLSSRFPPRWPVPLIIREPIPRPAKRTTAARASFRSRISASYENSLLISSLHRIESYTRPCRLA